MKRIFLSVLFTLSSQCLFAADSFRNIDGKNYYDFLEVKPTDNLTTIKAAYRKLIMAAHPDRGGDVEQAKKVNEAFDAIENQREKYDLWLSTGKSGAENFHSSFHKSEEEIRKEVLDAMVSETSKNLENTTWRYGNLNVGQLAEVGRITIVYNQRFMPMASIEANDLMYLILKYTLNEQAYEKWDNRTLLALAYGAIVVMKERAQYGDINGQFSKKLRELSSTLERIIRRNSQTRWWAKLADSIYQFLEGRSLIAELQAQIDAQRRHANSCQDALTTKIRVRDQNGVAWEVPISISIKLGN